MNSAVKIIAKSKMDLTTDPWRYVLWDPKRSVIVSKNSQLVKNLLLVSVGQLPDPRDFDVEDSYQKAIGEAQSTFEVPKKMIGKKLRPK